MVKETKELKKDIFERFNRLMPILHKEDERGLVLALAAFTEDILGSVLLAYMRPEQSARDLVEGFNAPLGTFAARIRAAHALGLITDEQQSDFDCLRKIRNEFAHNWDGVSFSQQKIAALLGNISPSGIVALRKSDDPKDSLIGSIGSSLMLLEVLRDTVKPVEFQGVHFGEPEDYDRVGGRRKPEADKD